MDLRAQAERLLPEDADRALLVARVFDPAVGGPCVAAVRDGRAVDLTPVAPTVSDLLERSDVHAVVGEHEGPGWDLGDLIDATLRRDRSAARLLAPVDLQVLKAAGVTFVRSMVERVIEERAKGDAGRAEDVRVRIGDAVRGRISQLRPGSPEAAAVKEVLVAEGLWSQYLEVGIGPDPEIFTKAPVLSAVGTGDQIGVLARSEWNNPEPELVLAVTSTGRPVAATLGNDVNLRDFEGRSALLLTEAKDNNASCAIGPFLRLFDDEFGLDDARAVEITLEVTGEDGFTLRGINPVSEISRDPVELIAHAHGPHHSYPDGFVLFTGTMFAPTEDRGRPGAGFTHRDGDVVSISSPRLGTLVNEVTSAEQAPDWTFGIRSLMANLAERGLLGSATMVTG
ncbi:fumarylacetoacetate (FAA) hydrolase family protein [Actinoalloteichus hoggarensis]|uniref:Fumarylacetoacetate (FAA) hydrolase family protein n=1 Tax=Actinoalloteichus hoggarensis TaxID=1470176 RepID=A0A221W3S5_9PSEU|nr:fumarylacetoacetate hydrolase family protein [Actinoalloteichus hoggarensis]ASO20520.1 Fumarylacetoacetate (FAA) hydrolase family protein [Actinoalloteichus hoggarensis]MBB5923560.1 fumarylacetoacetate (FAA) hydrolase family protein [Actinoalloteichus hoggarensis]